MMEDQSRRTFLKVAGASILGGVGAPVVAALASGRQAATGKQWAMVVDIKKCIRDRGCTKCVEACHREHNVPDVRDPRFAYAADEIHKRELKWIWKEDYEGSFPEQQHRFLPQQLHGVQVPVLCNHCENPPCVRVCPTQATWKRASDGIVMMDMHRCIGCRYCVVGCPYGARSFNWKEPWPRPFDQHVTPPNMKFPTRCKGVVEKCNFCAERLAASERTGAPFVPACVEACPDKALVVGDVNDASSAVRQILSSQHSIQRKPVLGTGPQIYYIV
jgi:molybdopterin-containing oxidoreductase family iron-sulfur binding subunit